MHEMPVVESIVDIVLRHAQANQAQRVVSVSLMVGDMSDLEEEWLQRYFEFFSCDTLAEGAQLKVTRTPVVLACSECGHQITVSKEEISNADCPSCHSQRFNLQSGHEYYIKEMEVV